MRNCQGSCAELSPLVCLSLILLCVFSLKKELWGLPPIPRTMFGIWIGSGSRPSR